MIASDLPLFAPLSPLPENAREGLTRAASHQAHLLDRLEPLAKELLSRHPEGITVSNVRLAAVQRGLLTGGETRAQLACLGALMQRVGEPTTEFRRSDVAKARGNLNRVYKQRGER